MSSLTSVQPKLQARHPLVGGNSRRDVDAWVPTFPASVVVRSVGTSEKQRRKKDVPAGGGADGGGADDGVSVEDEGESGGGGDDSGGGGDADDVNAGDMPTGIVDPNSQSGADCAVDPGLGTQHAGGHHAGLDSGHHIAAHDYSSGGAHSSTGDHGGGAASSNYSGGYSGGGGGYYG